MLDGLVGLAHAMNDATTRHQAGARDQAGRLGNSSYAWSPISRDIEHLPGTGGHAMSGRGTRHAPLAGQLVGALVLRSARRGDGHHPLAPIAAVSRASPPGVVLRAWQTTLTPAQPRRTYIPHPPESPLTSTCEAYCWLRTTSKTGSGVHEFQNEIFNENIPFGKGLSVSSFRVLSHAGF